MTDIYKCRSRELMVVRYTYIGDLRFHFAAGDSAECISSGEELVSLKILVIDTPPLWISLKTSLCKSVDHHTLPNVSTKRCTGLGCKLIEHDDESQLHLPVEFLRPATGLDAPRFSANGSFYHPKDCAMVSSIIGADKCTNYGVFDVENHVWVTTNLPQKVHDRATLYLRSIGVTQCFPDPRVHNKSTSLSFDLTQSSPVQMEYESFPSSQSSATSGVSSMGYDESRRQAAVVLPSLTALNGQGYSVSPFSSSSPSSTKSFPLQYTCDMGRGFDQMNSLELKKVLVPRRFQLVFGCTYKKSTYSDHRSVWNSIPHTERSLCVAAGHTPEGEWKTLVAKYGKQRIRP